MGTATITFNTGNSQLSFFLSSKIKMILQVRNWLRMASPLDYLECTFIDLLFYITLLSPDDGIMISLSGQIIS